MQNAIEIVLAGKLIQAVVVPQENRKEPILHIRQNLLVDKFEIMDFNINNKGVNFWFKVNTALTQTLNCIRSETILLNLSSNRYYLTFKVNNK